MAERTAPGPTRDYIIVFGAGVGRDGRPSRTLAHRIEGAASWAQAFREAMLIATGGVGRYGPAEAEVIAARLREKGVAGDRILIESHGRDTLESVRLCDRMLRARGDVGRILVCTSAFHQRRCALLFRLLGYDVLRPDMRDSRVGLASGRYARLVLKEVIATPYDALLLLGRRAIGRR